MNEALTDLGGRRRQPELMDHPDLDPEEHRLALRALARINAISMTAGALWSVVAPLAAEAAPRPLRVLDLACGGGEVLAGLARRAHGAGLMLAGSGWDASATAIAAARTANHEDGLDFSQHDCFAEPLPTGYDVCMTTLFLHHLDDPAAVELLASMRKAARTVLVDDLERSRAGWLMAWGGTRLLSRSRVVHVDGPRSVEGAFTREELIRLAALAGLKGARLRRHWPCRMLLDWRRA